MDDVTITRFDQGAGGEYRARVAGSAATGRLTFRHDNGAVIADQTIVPTEIGGRGVAGRLVDALIADARAHGWKIDPQCSYVIAAFERHPEWADLRA